MKLLIVESPSKAKTISKYLSGDADAKIAGKGGYQVVASVGHVRDLPKNNNKAIDIPAGFVPHYEISKGKEGVVAEIEALAKKADEVLLATDPDREGEAIAWHVAQAAHLVHPKRVVFHEITKEAVEEALLHPRSIDMRLKEAQEARRVLDRLVGYDLSGLIWKKVRYGLSAGRVQSPALRILMEREREIRAFKPETFWVITAETKIAEGKEAGKTLLLECTEEPRDQKEMERILAVGREAGAKNAWKVIDVKETEVKRAAKPPFTTSTLQQAASSRLGFSPSRTMLIAQKLYEAGFITYMRTDSTTLGGQAMGQISNLVQKLYGADYLEARQYQTKSKNAQEAHEAIRPSHVEKTSAGHNDEQKKLYQLIWQRTIASQMSDAKTLRTKVTANAVYGAPLSDTDLAANAKNGGAIKSGAGLKIPDFTINGSRVLFDGWLKADPEGQQDDVILPRVHENDALTLVEIKTDEKQTQPPARYSEAGLVKELEARGIGRPSTYASIIKTIVDRGYVEKIDRALKPTDTGDVVSSFLEENFAEYISDSFTAEMENKLDDIANGEKEYIPVLAAFYKPFSKEVKEKEKNTKKITDLGAAPAEFKCPICGSSMIIKLGKNGKFMSCSRFPNCTGALTIDGKEIAADKPIGTDPATNLPIFVKIGRFGPYVQLGETPKKMPKVPKSKKKKVVAEDGTTDASAEAAPATAPVAKPRMSSIPKIKDPSTVTVADALHYLSLPRVLGNHPQTGKPISANIGRFGPYVVHDTDFRSLKKDDVYTIELPRALEILAEPKKPRGFARKSKIA